MDPIAVAAATALLGAMATDSWQQVRTAVVAWWHKDHPEHSTDLSRALDSTYSKAMEARQDGAEDLRQALTDEWQERFQQLMDASPNVRQELCQLLDKDLAPALPPVEHTQVRQIIHLHAQDQARQYVAGRDQHISG